jgi:hypothetical protein
MTISGNSDSARSLARQGQSELTTQKHAPDEDGHHSMLG